MSDAQNTGRLGAERLEIACKVASIVLFVAAFMLAAVGAIHLAVLPGIIEPHLRNVAIEMALLALLLAVASTAVGVMGIMVVYHNYDAKRLLLASSGSAAFAIVGVLLAKFVIRGIFGMGSLTRPGVLVVLCSAVIAFACAKAMPRKPVTEDAEADPTKMPTAMAQKILLRMSLSRTMLMHARAKRLLPSLNLSREMRLTMTLRTTRLRTTMAPPAAMLLALPMRIPPVTMPLLLMTTLRTTVLPRVLTLASRATIGNRSRSRRPRTHLCAMLNQGKQGGAHGRGYNQCR